MGRNECEWLTYKYTFRGPGRGGSQKAVAGFLFGCSAPPGDHLPNQQGGRGRCGVYKQTGCGGLVGMGETCPDGLFMVQMTTVIVV